jgi:hypothetical protein
MLWISLCLVQELGFGETNLRCAPNLQHLPTSLLLENGTFYCIYLVICSVAGIIVSTDVATLFCSVSVCTFYFDSTIFIC